MRSYEMARTWFSTVETIGWWLLALGAFLILIGFGVGLDAAGSRGPSPLMLGLLGAAPGLLISHFAMSMIINIQNARASVDSAEYAQQNLKIAREQLAISRRQIRLASPTAESFEDLQNIELSSEPSPTGASYDTDTSEQPEEDLAADDTDCEYGVGDVFGYRGKTIRVVEAGYVVGGSVFASLGEAKKRIDDDPSALPPEPPAATEAATSDREYDIKGQKLVQMSDGTFVLNGIEFTSLDNVKEYLRLEAQKGVGR